MPTFDPAFDIEHPIGVFPPAYDLEGVLPPIVQRYFTDLTAAGGQFFRLSNTVVLATSCEIEIDICPQGSSNLQTIFSIDGTSSQFLRLTNITTTPVISFRTGGVESPIPLPDAVINKLQKLRVVKTGATVTAYLNGVIQGSSNNPAWDTTTTIDWVGRLGSGSQNFEGILANLKIWNNGNRETGSLIVDMPISTSLQNGFVIENRAAVLGVELAMNTVININSTTPFEAFDVVNPDPAGNYLCVLDVISSTAGTIKVSTSNQDTVFTSNTGIYTIISTNPIFTSVQVGSDGFTGAVRFSTKQIPSTTPYATAENITDADATERRRDNSLSPNRWG